MSELRIKRPADAWFYQISLAPLLRPGETVTGTPTITIAPSGALVASNITILTGGKIVQFKLSAGTDGVLYQLTLAFTITGNGTQSAEAGMQVQIDADA